MEPQKENALQHAPPPQFGSKRTLGAGIKMEPLEAWGRQSQKPTSETWQSQRSFFTLPTNTCFSGSTQLDFKAAHFPSKGSLNSPNVRCMACSPRHLHKQPPPPPPPPNQGEKKSHHFSLQYILSFCFNPREVKCNICLSFQQHPRTEESEPPSCESHFLRHSAKPAFISSSF